MRGVALFALLMLWLMLWPVEPAVAHVRNVRALDSRAFGYFLGDVIERRFEVDTDPGDELTEASLPHAGSLTYWLELKSVVVGRARVGGVTRHSLTLSYQNFYVPIDPRKLEIPPTTIAFKSGEAPYNVTLPPFTFIVSPIREIFPEKSGETVETFLRPDAAARFLPDRDLNAAVAVTGLVSLLALAVLAHHLAWWPFQKRRTRPFTRAAREISSITGAGQNSDAFRHALIELHRALDEAAGQRLLASDVATFLRRHPEHRGCGDDVARFFAASQLAFFANDAGAAERYLPTAELVELAQGLAREERASL